MKKGRIWFGVSRELNSLGGITWLCSYYLFHIWADSNSVLRLREQILWSPEYGWLHAAKMRSHRCSHARMAGRKAFHKDSRAVLFLSTEVLVGCTLCKCENLTGSQYYKNPRHFGWDQVYSSQQLVEVDFKFFCSHSKCWYIRWSFSSWCDSTGLGELALNTPDFSLAWTSQNLPSNSRYGSGDLQVIF